MTISTDTIRTVIEIVPGWKIYEGRYAPLQDEMAETPEGYRFFLTDQILLDYLAAAAVRVVDAHKHASIIFDYQDEETLEYGTAAFWDDEYILFRPDGDSTRTNNTIHIIAGLAERLSLSL